MRQLWLWLLDQKQRQLDVDGLPCSASHPGFLISQRRHGSVFHPHSPPLVTDLRCGCKIDCSKPQVRLQFASSMIYDEYIVS
jgi:hypothetical protein